MYYFYLYLLGSFYVYLCTCQWACFLLLNHIVVTMLGYIFPLGCIVQIILRWSFSVLDFIVSNGRGWMFPTNGVRDVRSNWLVAPLPSWAVPPERLVHSINGCSLSREATLQHSVYSPVSYASSFRLLLLRLCSNRCAEALVVYRNSLLNRLTAV